MKLFLFKLTLFFISIFLISLFIDIFISTKLKESKSFAIGESFIWKNIFEGKINDDLVIYGSSRAWRHFDPEFIEDSLGIQSYNLGIDGHSFWLQYLRHKELIKSNKEPKVILLSVGIFTFSKRKDLNNKDQFLPFIFNKDIYDFTSSFNGFTLLDYTIPLYRYIGKKNDINNTFKSLKNNLPLRVKGFKGASLTWNDDFAKVKSTMDSYYVVIDEPTKNIFHSFLKYCKDSKINLIIVYSPEFIEGQNFVTNRNEIIETFEFFSNRYNIPFLNYSNDSMSSDKKLFYNNLHLNSEGAMIFTNKLIKDLNKYNLINYN